MAKIKLVVLCFMAMLISACVSPNIDTASPGFNEQKYQTDLDTCRDGNSVVYALYTAGGTFVGAVIGASSGAYYGAIAGDSVEGTVIGAAAGAVVGFGTGAVAAEYSKKRKVKVESCLRNKGYVLRAG